MLGQFKAGSVPPTETHVPQLPEVTCLQAGHQIHHWCRWWSWGCRHD